MQIGGPFMLLSLFLSLPLFPRGFFPTKPSARINTTTNFRVRVITDNERLRLMVREGFLQNGYFNFLHVDKTPENILSLLIAQKA